MTNVDEHHYHSLHILKSSTHDAYFLVFLEQSVVSINLKPDTTLCFFLHFLQYFFLLPLDVRNHLINKNKFALYLTFRIVQL